MQGTRSKRSRIDLLAIVLMAVMGIFVLRLFYLQVIRHEHYQTAAKQTQQRNFTIPAVRGQIYMMDGKKIAPVVLNQAVYTVFADPSAVKSSDIEKIITALRDVAGGEMSRNAEELLKKEGSRYAVIAKNITRSQAEKLKKYDFPGVGFQQGSVRNYPEGQLAAHVLGFVNAEGAGNYGVEQQMNDVLKGRDGALQSVTDVRNVPLYVGKDNVRIEPQPGKNVLLTIDRNVQSYAEEALKRGIDKAGATEGSILVMNPNNGEVMAMANYPTYSPGEFSKVENMSVYDNASTMWPYEPASVIKTFTMATGVDKGVITAQTPFYNTDCIQVVDRTMCNATRGLGGPTNMQQVLNNSLNVGTITIARKLGNGASINAQARQTMYEYFHDKFGLGEKTGIEVPEVAGYIHPPDSAEGNEVRYSAMTYGQSLSLTMIQVAAGFCSVINGGEYYKPTLMHGTVDGDEQVSLQEQKPLRRTISELSSAEMKHMLVTARRSSWMGKEDPSGYDIGGKTGTAETVSATGEYTRSETVATYVGFGGTERPEYVIMVRVAAPGRGLNLEGGLHASPVFSDMSNWMIDYMKLAPKG